MLPNPQCWARPFCSAAAGSDSNTFRLRRIPWIIVIAWIIIARTRKQGRDPAMGEQQHSGLNEQVSYLQWLHQRQDERTAIEKERIGKLSAESFRAVCGGPALGTSQCVLEMAQRQLPNGSPQFFWDMISKLDGIVSQGIPDKV
jgi:hypothetical protein